MPCNRWLPITNMDALQFVTMLTEMVRHVEATDLQTHSFIIVYSETPSGVFNVLPLSIIYTPGVGPALSRRVFKLVKLRCVLHCHCYA